MSVNHLHGYYTAIQLSSHTGQLYHTLTLYTVHLYQVPLLTTLGNWATTLGTVHLRICASVQRVHLYDFGTMKTSPPAPGSDRRAGESQAPAQGYDLGNPRQWTFFQAAPRGYRSITVPSWCIQGHDNDTISASWLPCNRVNCAAIMTRKSRPGLGQSPLGWIIMVHNGSLHLKLSHPIV